MFNLIFTNSRGENIELFGRPYRLIRVEGLGDVEADVQTQKAPYQDGESLVDTVLEPRFMTLELKIVGTDLADVEEKRRRLSTVFNPKLQLGTLKYVRDDTVREIKAVAESVPNYPDGLTNRGQTFQRALIFLNAPNPYWLDDFTSSEEMAYVLGGFQLPFSFPVEFAMRARERSVINIGDVDTPVEIEFRGPAINPVVTNETTGEFIRVNRELGANDILTVSTELGNKYVRINGENAFHYIDIQSTFWQLRVGENLLSYTSNNDSELTRVKISYRNRYVAV